MIRILGAGVSGLTAALALARAGRPVELIDESFAIPPVGTALGLFPPAQRVLEQVGVLEPVRRRAATPREGHLLGAAGQVLATVPAGGGLLVSRSDLVSILHDALPASVRRRREPISDVRPLREERKSTRLNSSHVAKSYAVFCLKRKILVTLARIISFK